MPLRQKEAKLSSVPGNQGALWETPLRSADAPHPSNPGMAKPRAASVAAGWEGRAVAKVPGGKANAPPWPGWDPGGQLAQSLSHLSGERA